MKKLLLTMAVTLAASSQAQDSSLRWALLEPKSGTTVLMGNVSFLLASDWQDTFSIVCKDGTVVTGAETVSFAKVEPTGITPATAADGGPQIAALAAGRLTLAGCKAGAEVGIYDAAGRMVAGCTAAEGRTDIDVSRLATGVYLLRAGDTAVKFIKK